MNDTDIRIVLQDVRVSFPQSPYAPWTFTFNLTRQPAISVPMGPRADGLPNSVQIAAAQYRDDLVLRAARAIELAQPFQVADLG